MGENALNLGVHSSKEYRVVMTGRGHWGQITLGSDSGPHLHCMVLVEVLTGDLDLGVQGV